MFGEHRGHRPVHAKGIVCAGTFTGHPGAARICRAAHLQGEKVTVAARLSNGSGYPDAPDWVRDRRGLAVKFALPDGTTADLVAISHPVYFARAPQDLVDFSRMRLRDCLAAHPYAAPAIAIGQSSPLPASYTSVAYHAVHAFALHDAEGTWRWARWHGLPEHGRRPLPRARRASQPRLPPRRPRRAPRRRPGALRPRHRARERRRSGRRRDRAVGRRARARTMTRGLRSPPSVTRRAYRPPPRRDAERAWQARWLASRLGPASA